MVSNITIMNFTVSAPIRKKTVLVFDVETNSAELGKYQDGLNKKYGDKKVNLETGVLS